MLALAEGRVRIPHTRQLVARFREIQVELAALVGEGDLRDFVLRWLGNGINEDDTFHSLVLDVVLNVNSPADLLSGLVEAVSQPEIPPDITEVRIMSLHKSKGLSSPVVIIAGCVEGLLPAAADPDLTPAERRAALEEQRRLLFVGLTRVKADRMRNRPGILVLTSSRSMSLADAMQSGITPVRVQYGRAHVHSSRFIHELGPAAPPTQRG